MTSLKFQKIIIFSVGGSFFIAFFLLSTLFLPSFALALSSGGVGGYPANPDPSVQYSESWFIYNLDLGESKDDALLVFNTADEPRAVKIYAVDSTPSNQGNFALKGEGDPKVGLGGWIELSVSLITLEPGESREIPFTITVPEDADVGEHSGGIILEKTAVGTVEASGASIVTRVGIRVYQTVPGEIIRDIEIKDFSVTRKISETDGPFYEINITAQNKGNVSLTPEADLKISGFGKIDYSDIEDISVKKFKQFFTGQAEFPIHFFKGQTLERNWQLLRDQEVTTRWTWPEPQFGRYSFQVHLTYTDEAGDINLTTDSITIWIVPWIELGVVGGIFGFIILLTILKKILFSTRKWQTYQVKPGDQLVSLAEMSGVKWKKLAKINKLKTPLLKSGQKIILPPKFKSTAKSQPSKQPSKKISNNKSA